MLQNQKAGDFFSPLQYVLGDTAFEPSNIAIAAYRCQKGFVQDRDEQMVNTCMTTPCVITEHTMGIWKGGSHGFEILECLLLMKQNLWSGC